MASKNDSHFPNDKHDHETAPLRQHHRMACDGTKAVNGTTNPNGAEKAPGGSTVAGQKKDY